MLQVNGRLEPQRLQAWIRQIGALPGVGLSPVTAQAHPAQERAIRRLLLDVQLTGVEAQPMPMMARTAAAPTSPPDPAELAPPKDRLSLLVRFCAR